MNPQVKEKWVAALRSGEYKQGTGALKLLEYEDSQPRYCCLGVLCDLHQKETGNGYWEGGTYYATDEPANGLNYSGSYLPLAVRQWAGLDYENPVVYPIGMTLAGLNDQGKPFEAIAEVIEVSL